MDNLVRVYDNVIDDNFCDYLVNKFENSPEQWQVESNTNYDFTQIEMGKNMKSWQSPF